jgi:hypothetical protein
MFLEEFTFEENVGLLVVRCRDRFNRFSGGIGARSSSKFAE